MKWQWEDREKRDGCIASVQFRDDAALIKAGMAEIRKQGQTAEVLCRSL